MGRFDHFDGRPGGSYRMTLTYEEAPAAGGKSDANTDVVEARFVDIVPDEISRRDHVAGMESSLSNLASYLVR